MPKSSFLEKILSCSPFIMKNKKKRFIQKPKFFREFEVLRLEDRITPAYNFLYQNNELSIILTQNVPNPANIGTINTSISITGQILKISSSGTYTDGKLFNDANPGNFGTTTVSSAIFPYVNPTGGTSWEINLNNPNFFNGGLINIGIQPLPNGPTNSGINNAETIFNFGNFDLRNIINTPNIGITTTSNNVQPNNGVECDVIINSPVFTQGNGNVIIDVGTYNVQPPNGTGSSGIFLDGGTITTVNGGTVNLKGVGIFLGFNNPAQINTSGGSVTVNGGVLVSNETGIFTNGGNTNGANIDFGNSPITGDSQLTLSAGSAGNIFLNSTDLFTSNGKLRVLTANLFQIVGFGNIQGGIDVNCTTFDASGFNLSTVSDNIFGPSKSGDVKVTASGDITFGILSTQGYSEDNAGVANQTDAGNITLVGNNIVFNEDISASGGSNSLLDDINGNLNAGIISVTASSKITVKGDISATGGRSPSLTGLGGQVYLSGPVELGQHNTVTGLNTYNRISTFGTNTGNSGNIVFSSNSTISSPTQQSLILDAAKGGSNPSIIGDIFVGGDILNNALSSFVAFGGLIELNNIGNASQAGVNGTVNISSFTNDIASPNNRINFRGNNYNSSGSQVYSGVAARSFLLSGAASPITSFITQGGAVTFSTSVLELDQSDLNISTNGGNVSTNVITSNNLSTNKDVTINAQSGKVTINQIGGINGSFGNANGINTVAITGNGGISMGGSIVTSSSTGNSVTLNGPVSVSANVVIDTSANTVDNTGAITLNGTLNAVGQKTVTLDAAGSLQSGNVTITGLIGAGLSGVLGALSIEGNQVTISGIGSSSQFGVAPGVAPATSGATTITAVNNSGLGSITLTGDLYRTNGTQSFNATGLNPIVLNPSAGSSVSFVTLNKGINFTGSVNLNSRNMQIDTTNALISAPGVGGANVTFNGSIFGAANLNITAGNTGIVNFAQDVGGGQALNGVVINSSAGINSQAISVSGANPITLTSDAFNLAGFVSSASGTITLQPNTLSKSMAINNSFSANDIVVTNSVIGNFSTAGTVIYGNASGTGNISIADQSLTTFPYKVTFRTGSTANINLNGSVRTSGNAITFDGKVVLAENVTMPVLGTPTINSTTGQVLTVPVVDPGAGFQTAPGIVLTGGGGSGATAIANMGVQATAVAVNGTTATATSTLGNQATATVTLGTQATAGAITLGTTAQGVATLGSNATASAVYGTQASGTATIGGATATATATAGTTASATISQGTQATAVANLGQQATGFLQLGTLASATANVGNLATGAATVGTAATATANVGQQATAHAVLGNGTTQGVVGQIYTIPVDKSGTGYFTGVESVSLTGGSGYRVGDTITISQSLGNNTVPAIGDIIQLGSVITAISGTALTGGPAGANQAPFQLTILPTAFGTTLGVLGDVVIENAGSGYPANTEFPVSITGAGAGNVPAIGLATTNASGNIIDVRITNLGLARGFTGGSILNIVALGGVSGSGGQVQAITGLGGTITVTTDATTGVFTGASLNQGGSGYVEGVTYNLSIGGGFTGGSVTVQTRSLTGGSRVIFGESFRGLNFVNGAVQQTGTSGSGSGLSGVAFVGPKVQINGGNPTIVGSATAVLGAFGTVNQGRVIRIDVQSPGLGYTSAPTISLGGPGIESLTPTNPGSGYLTGTSAPSVTINGGNGSQATATPNVVNGQVISYTITNPGFGYSGSAPTVTVDEPGILSISPTNLGSGYSVAPTVTISGGGGSGATATGNLGTGANAGKVTSYTVTNLGTNYTSTGVKNAYLPDATYGGTGYVPNSSFPISLTGQGVINVASGTAFTDASGSISRISISSLGSGYNTTQSYAVNGGNATAVAIIDTDSTNATFGQVIGYDITDPGSGYTVAPTVIFTGGGGSGAAATATINGGLVTGLTITSPGSGYTSSPTITLSRAGSFASAVASIDANNKVTAITPSGSVNSGRGAGYITPPRVIITGGGGTGATATAVLGAGATAGQVVSYTITNQGQGYTSTPTVYVESSGTASVKVELDPIIVSVSNPGLQSIDVPGGLASGSGYSVAPSVTVNGGGGSGALATATIGTGATANQVISYNLTTSGQNYSTSLISNTYTGATGSAVLGTGASAGTVASITPILSGSSYFSAPIVTISAPGGSGTQATAVAILGNGAFAGQVVGYKITNAGSGYATAPTVTITSPISTITSGTTATASAVLGTGVDAGKIISLTTGITGSGYNTPPVVTISGDGTGATAIAVLGSGSQTGQIVNYVVTNTGSGYTNATINVTPPGVYPASRTNMPITITGTNGIAADGIANTDINGNITSVTVTGLGGTGYINGNSYSITYTNPLTGAKTSTSSILALVDTATVVISNPGVAKISTPSNLPTGSAYVSAPTVNITGGSGFSTAATATAILGSGVDAGKVVSYNVNSGIGYSTGLLTQTYTVPTTTATATATVSTGFVTAISVPNGGSGYTSIPTVTINGDGTGATAIANISGGVVTGITITNRGTGYTNATVTINSPIVGGTGYLANQTALPVTITGGNGAVATASATTDALGAITSVTVLNGGSGYIQGNTYTISSNFGGYNGTIIANLNIPNITISQPGLLNVTPVNIGSGYQTAPTVFFSGGGGTGAAATAVLTGDKVTSFVLTNAGSGYTSAPVVSLSAPGIDTITLGSGGSGYASAPTVTISPPDITGGTQATAVATLTGDTVTGITITNRGSGYSTLPTITFSAPGLAAINVATGGSGYSLPPAVTIGAPNQPGGVQATATANISGGVVTGYTITNPGSGYTSNPLVTIASPGALSILTPGGLPSGSGYSTAPTVTLVGGTFTTAATATAVLGTGADAGKVIGFIVNGGSGYTVAPSVVIDPPPLFSINPVSTGAGYTTAPNVTLSGSGTGATAVANLGTGVDAGKVVSYTVTSFGSGYTGPINVTVDPAPTGVLSITTPGGLPSGSNYSVPPQVTITGGGGSGAQFNAVLGTGVDAGKVIGFSQVSAGTGYSFAPTITLSAPGIATIPVANGGSGYSVAPQVTLSGGDGTGATATATVVGGVVTAINITNFGNGYTIAPTATLGLPGILSVSPTATGSNYGAQPPVIINGGGGSGAVVTANVSAGGVTSYNVISSGSGFISVPNVIVGAPGIATIVPVNNGTAYSSVPSVTITGGGGSGATATAVLGTGPNAGQIVSYNITNPGVGYTSAPSINVSSPGLAGISVTEMGTGYSSLVNPVVTITGGGGTGATATAVLGTGANAGKIVQINLTNQGSGYTSTPTINISQPGIASITVTNGGTGYTSTPTVTVVPYNSVDTTNSSSNPIGANITFNSTINGLSNGVQSLELNSGTAGIITLNNSTGGLSKLNSLKINNSNGANFIGPINVQNNVQVVNSTNGSDIKFNGLVTAAGMDISSDVVSGPIGYNLYLIGGTNISGPVVFNNTGSLQLGDSSTDSMKFSGGMVATAPSQVNLGGSVTTGSGQILTQATGSATLLSGGVSAISVTNPGAGYKLAPTVTITPPDIVGGVQATAIAIINSSGVVTGFTPINPGSGYSIVPGVVIAPPPPPTLIFGDSDTQVTMVANSSVASGSGPIVFGGALTDGTSSYQLSLQFGGGTGKVDFNDNVTIDSVLASSNAFDVNFNGTNNLLTGISGFGNNGTVRFGNGSSSSSTTFANGLTVSAANIEVAGALNTIQGDMNLGSSTKTVTLTNNAQIGSGSGALKFYAPVNGSAYDLTLQGLNASGPVSFAKNVNLGSLITSVGSYNINFNSTDTVTGNQINNAANFLNTGIVTFNGKTTFNNGVTATTPSISLAGSLLTTGDTMLLGNVSLNQVTGSSTISSAGPSGGGLIEINTIVEGPSSSLQPLILMDNTLNSNNGQVNFLGNASLTGLTTYAKSYGIAFMGSVNTIKGLSSTKFNNTGTTTFGNDATDQITFVSGVSTNDVTIAGKVLTTGTAASFGNVTITTSSEIDTGNGSLGAISTKDILMNGYTLTLDSGTIAGSTITVDSINNLLGDLVVRDAGGLVSFTGQVGTATTRGNITIANSNAGVTFNGNVTANQINLNGTQSNKNIIFNGNLDLTGNLVTAAQGYNLQLLGLNNLFANPNSVSFNNLGSLKIGATGSTNTFANGFSVTSPSSLSLNGTFNSPGVVNVSKPTNIDGNVILNLSGSGSSAMSGSLIGSSSLELTGSGKLSLGKDSPAYTGNLIVSGGTLTVNSNFSKSNVIQNAGNLAGIGVVGNITSNGGTLAPGNSPGILTSNNALLSNASTFAVELFGNNIGQFDQLSAASIALGNAALSITTSSASLKVGQVYTIVNNTGLASVSGTFGNLPEASTVVAGGVTFRISYVGGTKFTQL